MSYIYGNKKLDGVGRIIYGLLIVTYALLVAFRPENVIPDVESYKYRYIHSSNITSLSEIVGAGLFSKVQYYSMGVGASFLSYISFVMGIPFAAYSFIIAIIEIQVLCSVTKKMMSIVHMDVNKLSILPIVMVVYGYYYMFIAFAQGIAMLLVFCAFYLFLRKKILRCIVLLLLSMTFHNVGIVGVVVIVLYAILPRLKDSIYKWSWWFTFILIITGAGFFISDRVRLIVGVLLNVGIKYNSLYSQYDVIEEAGRTSIVNIVTCLFIGVMAYTVNKKIEYWKYVNILFIAIIMMGLFPSWGLMHRIYDVLLMFLVPTVCMFVNNHDGLKIRIRNGEIIFTYFFIVLKFMSMMSIYLTFTLSRIG